MTWYEYMELRSEWVTAMAEWWDFLLAAMCSIGVIVLVTRERRRKSDC